MSDKFLSQEEIDSLLKMNSEINSEVVIDETAKDVLGEIGNISMSNAATALSSLLNNSVNITTPKVELTTIKELNKSFVVPYVLLQIKFEDGFEGSNALMMRIQDAAVIANIMMGGDGSNPNENLSEIELSAVSEAMNQMMGSASTALSTLFSKRVNISPPTIRVVGENEVFVIDDLENDDVVKISFQLTVNGLIDSEIMQIYPLKTAEQMIDEMIGPKDDQAEIDVESYEEQIEEYEEDDKEIVEVKKPKFKELSKKQTVRGKSNIDMIMDVPLELSVVLGSTRTPIKKILSLEPGSIVELNENVEDPLDIFVNGKQIAKGEVVVIDEKFGIRITQILNPKDRVKKLG